MRFFRAYIEITNSCGLACSFCPPKQLASCVMPLELFSKILDDVKPLTNEVALHVMGDPLVLSNLSAYLDLVDTKKMKAHLTTTGYFLANHQPSTLLHPTLKQVNFSLNSYNKNSMNITMEAYLQPILELIKKKVADQTGGFINLRLWNLDEVFSEEVFNHEIFEHLNEAFGTHLDMQRIMNERPKSIRLASKVRVHFDDYFEWPSLHSPEIEESFCHGLSGQLAILCDGTVVPCCLDKDGIINLGNVSENPLKKIIQTPRSVAIVEGFKAKKAVETLCQRCSYRSRFLEKH
jgi:radical SAM protein with 4Fe4S-binding SPASM domain